jgi:hypothetical protein
VKVRTSVFQTKPFALHLRETECPPRARKSVAVVFVFWLGLNAYVLVWLVLRVSGSP